MLLKTVLDVAPQPLAYAPLLIVLLGAAAAIVIVVFVLRFSRKGNK